MYEKVHGRLEKLQVLMGYGSVISTVAYLKSFQRKELTTTVLSVIWGA
jgi:hypothetical protein